MPDGSRAPSSGLKPHPLAEAFPMMEGEAFALFAKDIAAHGLRMPIVLHEGKILDGRNRYRACREAGVTLTTEQFVGSDPMAFVISTNLQRRHLDESQRAMVAAKLATMPAHRPAKSANLPTSQPTAASMLNVSGRSVRSAAAVLKSGSADLVRKVEQGSVSVAVGEKIAKMPTDQQKAVLAEPTAKIVGSVKKVVRAKRESELGRSAAKASALLSRRLYSVIYADPPWRFEPYSRETGMDRAADNHYPCMTTDDICALKVPAADSAALFLWATAPMLPAALRVMEAWGFAYRSHFVWIKDRVGTGYWARNKHELLLIGVRGDVPAPAPGEQYESAISAPVGKHSAKPPAFAEIIEDMFPSGEKLEMFARASRLGWDVWGNEAAQIPAAVVSAAALGGAKTAAVQ